MSSSRDAALLRLARRQDGNLTHAQMIDLGFSRSWVHRRRRDGFLEPVHRDVDRLTSSPASDRQVAHAAVLAVGPEALVCGLTAAALWGLADVRLTSPIAVASPRRCRRRLEGVRVRFVRSFDRRDRTTLGGLPITAVPRTVLDCADPHDPTLTEDIVVDAVRQRRATRRALIEIGERVPNAPGLRTMRRVLDRFDPGAVERLMSRLEGDYLRLFRAGRLPPPQVNRILLAPDGTLIGKLDFMWDPPGVVVEVDGLPFHATRLQKEHDGRRQNAIVLSGRRVLRYTSADLADPARVISEIRSALDATT